MITFPNAKINLGLDVVEKRPDGYHNLETVFYPIPLCDILEITPAKELDAPDYTFTMYNAVFEGSDDDNLVIKAYKALAADHKLPKVDISLYKHIPTGAGLGGGSADAAFALKMLNELCTLGLSEEQLACYAARLGSDCAFFVYNRPMIGEGRGEILAEYPIDLEAYDLQVITPVGVAVSTKEAYSGIRPHLPEIPLREALARPVEEWDGLLANDFEETVFVNHPELAAIKRSLYDSGAAYASMSGSGSALFALYRK